MTGTARLILPRAAFGAALGLGLGLGLAAPAFAQSSQGQSSQGQSSQGQSSQGQSDQSQSGQGHQAQGGSASQSCPGQQRSQAQIMGQDKLRRQLTQAGFREVQILDAAYLVQAKTQDGNTVLMMIDPPHGNLQGAGMQCGAQGASASSASSPPRPATSSGGGTAGSGQGR